MGNSMWVFQIFQLIWNNLFNITFWNGITFGQLLLGVFVLSFIVNTIYIFMHRGDNNK